MSPLKNPLLPVNVSWFSLFPDHDTHFQLAFHQFPLIRSTWKTYQSLEGDWSLYFFGLSIFPIHGNSKVNKTNWKSVNQEFCLNQMWYNCVWSIQVFLENYWYRNMLVWLRTSSNKSQIRKCFIYEKSALLNTFKIAVKDICMFEVWY